MTAPPLSRRHAALAEAASLATLAAPLVAGLVVATGILVVDTAMLGPLGALPLAAVSLASSVIIIFYAALYGFAGPVGLFAGRAHGAQDLPEIGRVARHGAVLAAIGGTLGAAMMASVLLVLPHIGLPEDVLAILGPYWLFISAMLLPFTLVIAAKNLLDATDRPWTAVALTCVTVGLNVVFNYALIYGHFGAPALGLTGAGVASFLAQTLGAFIIWGYVRFHPTLATWWTRPGLNRAGLTQQWREALPMTIQYFLEGAAVALAGILIGYFGATALAGNQIALAVGATLYMLPLGIAAAVTIRVAQVIGAEERIRVAAIGHAGLGIVTIWMGVFAVVFVVAGAPIASLFIDDPAVIAAAAAIFVVFGCTQLCDGIQSVSLGALRGMLDNQWPTQVSLIAYWLIALPLSYLFGFTLDYGAPGVWAGFGIGLLIAAIALGLRFHAKTQRFH